MSERNRVSGMIYNTNEKGWKYRTGEWAVMVTLLGHFLGNCEQAGGTEKGGSELAHWSQVVSQ